MPSTLRTSRDELAGGDLSQRVKIKGTRKIAALGRSFNVMADALEARLIERDARQPRGAGHPGGAGRRRASFSRA